MSNSPLLKMPYILPSQAQKHVTHNESLRTIDAILQLSVLDRDLAIAPGIPAEGDRYLIAAGASGAWSGKDGQITAWQDGAWMFHLPVEGWLAWVADEDAAIVFDGAAWVALGNGGGGGGSGLTATDLQDGTITELGVNASADMTNRLVVSSPAVLLDRESNDIRVKLNKQSAGDTASVIFQTSYSARAEFGLAGDDNFSMKVSADGITFNTGISIDRNDGLVSFPNKAVIPHNIQCGGRWYCYSDNRWIQNSTLYGFATDNHNGSAGTGTEPNIDYSSNGAFLRSGDKIVGLAGGFRRSSNQLTAFDIRLFFQYGPWTGTWDSAGETTQETIFSQDGIDLSSPGWKRLDAAFSEYTCPDDGFINMAMRSVGTLTTTRYIYSQFLIECLAVR